MLPKYPNYDKHDIKVVAVGTGQAIMNSKNCDGDLLIVHDKERELEFMSQGFGIKRHSLMYNDFVIVGPSNDPAQISKSKSPADAFLSIAANKSKFISRADSSGTHAAENKIWNDAQLNPLSGSGLWYLETGQGMGPSLNIAIATDAYIFTDRSSWVKYKNKRNHLILFQDSSSLKNEYGMIIVNYHRCKNINANNVIKLYDWLSSSEAKQLINDYTVLNSQLFYTY